MATARKTVAEMTVDELKRLINATIDERGQEFSPDEFQEGWESGEDTDTRSLEEVLRSMKEHRWTPPPGTPTPSEMIREDRDSH